MKPLKKRNKKELLEIAESMGLNKVTKETTNDTIVEAIEYKADEMDSMVTAKLNARTDMPAASEDKKKGGVYLGKCVKTGKKLYS